MNEPFDPLEAELEALQPRKPSPELRHRIAADLATNHTVQPARAQPVRQTPARMTGRIAGAVAIAACAIAALLLWPAKRPVTVDSRGEDLQATLAEAFDEALPSVWTYQRALSHSPSEIDSLLDRHAAAVQTNDRSFSTHFLIRSDNALLLQGEL